MQPVLRILVAVVVWILIWAPWSYTGTTFLWRAIMAALIVLLGGSFFWWWSASTPDDDGDDCPLKLGARRFLIFYLVIFGVLLISGIVFLSWFDFTPVDDALQKQARVNAAITLKPAAYGRLKTPWGDWWLSLNVELLLLAVLAGALGSYIHAVKSLADFLGNRTAKTSWFYFYLTRPFLGAALALLFYAVVRGGFMAGTPADANAVNPYGVIAICGLVGMFSDRAAQKLSEVFETLFRTDDARKDKLVDLKITTMKLPDGVVATPYGPVSLTAIGGSGGYKWSIAEAPQGIVVDEKTNSLTGKPAANTQGEHTVSLTVEDKRGAKATVKLLLVIRPQ
jgi:hypothetical protein